MFSPELVDVKFNPGELPHLSEAQLEMLKQLCLEYADVFSVDNEIGRFPPKLLPKFKIVLKDGAQPKQQRPYRLSKHEEEWLADQISKLVQLGVAKKCEDYTWVSPVVIVKHPRTGDLRMCLDLRALNAATEPMVYQMPRVDECINSMKGCEFFSHLDVRRGFWHMPIEEAHCHLTSFGTPWGVFCFNRTPFGLVNAPADYQQCMDTVFQGLQSSKTYMDDTFCYTKAGCNDITSTKTCEGNWFVGIGPAKP
jgi:hypothetical protein